MKVVVIGASGTIGRPLADALAQRHEVAQGRARKETIKQTLRPKSHWSSFSKQWRRSMQSSAPRVTLALSPS